MFIDEAKLISPTYEAALYGAMQEMILQPLQSGTPGLGSVTNGWEEQGQVGACFFQAFLCITPVPVSNFTWPSPPLCISNLCLLLLKLHNYYASFKYIHCHI